MVSITDYSKRTDNEGEPFNVLHLQGEIEMVKSAESGQYYATARETTIPSTFSDEKCESLLGKELQGSIEKVPCDNYEYEIPETGETIILDFTWEFNPAPVSLEEQVFEGKGNGVHA